MSDDNSIEKDDVVKLIQDIIVGVNAQYQVRFKDLEDRLDKFEQQIATLVLAYGETSVFVETLVAQLAFASEEEQKNFTTNLAENRKTMLEVMQNAANSVVASESPIAGSTISNLAEQKLSEANSE